MDTLTTADQLRTQVSAWKRDGKRVGLVPTMGNLHAGHYSLIDLAKQHADHVVASVFVNPTQFGPNEDFAHYPRTPDADAEGLAAHGCDVLFAPSVAEMYPEGAENAELIRAPGITGILDGAHRPGHFDGVATVVARLFDMVQPDVAVFGQKDYQQLQVIRGLVRDLALPIELLAGPTVRAEDGLSLSSRNQYLSAAERAIAPEIPKTLLQMRYAARTRQPLAVIEAEAVRRLTAAGFVVDYAAILRSDLAPPADEDHGEMVALIAARLGNTRLIDNMLLDRPVDPGSTRRSGFSLGFD
ncbi:MAG TPA: pantoate--beta-alanine ligase [Xanthomonadaceae bacterium]|nr:pantoate--beta-alanine ligase [Xanthomonadaceae bacterium]